MDVNEFKHVSYLWDKAKAAELAGDEVALLIYRSNLLGADLRLTNYGGGNTSCKAMAKDPLTGVEKEVMWVKGSGGDIGTLKKNGLAALHMDRLLNLKNIYSMKMKWWSCSIIVFMIWLLKLLLLIPHYMGSYLSNILIICIQMQLSPLLLQKMEKKLRRNYLKEKSVG
jgi:hypothetical protein